MSETSFKNNDELPWELANADEIPDVQEPVSDFWKLAVVGTILSGFAMTVVVLL